jgi:hypothetical protein
MRMKAGTVTMLALGILSALTSTAWAVALPEFSVETGLSEGLGTAVIETNAAIVGKVTCAEGSGEYTMSSKASGADHLQLSNCVCKKTSALGGGTAVAESLGDSARTVLSLGTFTLVRLKTADAGVFLLVTPFDIDCLYSTEELLNIKGSFLGLLEPILTKTKSFKLTISQSGGVQSIKEYENDNGTKVAAEGLKTEVANTGGFIKSAVELAICQLTAATATEVVKTT